MSKTVRVRVAVSVDPEGEWYGVGWKGASDEEMRHSTLDCVEVGERSYFLTAELEIPEPVEVDAHVEEPE